ncbi:MAG TPA: hypothetical protein VM052_01840 [Candidatus Limnocylindrales bacterium]|nr:hypothetical protein [Candidatus Limnocylindrales bacterium]
MIRDREAARPAAGTSWTTWPVNWSAVLIGALAAIVAAVLLGLIGTAIGAHKTGNEGRITSWSGVGFASLAFAVISSFFAFAIGGWIAARIAGIRRAEDATLHGALAWLLGVFIMVALAAMSGAVFNGWYASLAPTPAVPAVPGQPADPNLAIALRNGALATAAAFLIGLMGAVIGGWVASGEPMTVGRYRVRLEPYPEVRETRTTDRTTRM